jgi:hypothetical protein
VFLFLAALATLFGVFPGGWFEEGAERDATLLTTTFAAVAVVLTVAVTLNAFRHGHSWAWWALWGWPLFFIVHGVAFFAVDFAFAAMAALALAVTHPSGTSAASGA